MKKGLTYKEAGVDIKGADRFVKTVKRLAEETRGKGVLSGVGGFASLFTLKHLRLKDPVLVSSTDGVGTKLKVAIMADEHSTVGIDLVAMCVNDIVTVGARPLFFLDYLSVGKLKRGRDVSILRGIARGCKEAGCALVGGETAEMPGLYGEDEYDLAGFVVGVVEKKKIIDGSRIRAGDVLVGLPSSGLHSNGYSLVRKLLFERFGLGLGDSPKGLRTTLKKELLKPTRIYVKTVLDVVDRFPVKGIAHITGGGLTENIPRILPDGYKAVIEPARWKRQPIFDFIEREGDIPRDEMFRTFNCGIGLVLVVGRAHKEGVVERLVALGEKPTIIGTVEKGRKGVEYI